MSSQISLVIMYIFKLYNFTPLKDNVKHQEYPSLGNFVYFNWNDLAWDKFNIFLKCHTSKFFVFKV